MSIDWLDTIDLTPPKVAKAPVVPKKEPFKEMDLTRRYNYRGGAGPAPKMLPKGSMIESVIIENTELKNKEWAVARKAIARADRARMGAEYREKFMLNLLTQT